MAKDEVLTTRELAERWKMSEATLKRWRYEGLGPRYMKLVDDGKILYRLKDIMEYEEGSVSDAKR